MAFEAMNNAGALKNRLIVILNDNDMSIAPPVGAMSAYLARLLSGTTYKSMRRFAKGVAGMFSDGIEEKARQIEEYARGLATGGTLFEEMGFYYVGPVTGTISTILCRSCKMFAKPATARRSFMW